MVQGASAFLFCYDASDGSSISDIDNWIEIAKKHKRWPETKKYLVGLKADLIDSGQQVALTKLLSKYLDNPELEIKHIIVSAHKSINIDALIGELADDLIDFP